MTRRKLAQESIDKLAKANGDISILTESEKENLLVFIHRLDRDGIELKDISDIRIYLN